MKMSKNKSQFILVFAIAQTIGLAVSAMIALFGTVEKQSVEHQKALSPIFEFVIDEIIQPLYFVAGIAESSNLYDLMNSESIVDNDITNELQRLKNQTGYNFFVASEKSKKQYNADGSSFELTKGEVEWYYRAKEKDQKMVGAIGNRQSPHLYFDIKVFDENACFSGFIGLGIPLRRFLKSFDSGKSIYDYELIIVDDATNVVFATESSLMADGHKISTLQELPWYQALSDSQRNQDSINNEIVSVSGNKLLIAEMDVEEINWKIYLINPLKLRQGKLLSSFLLQTSLIFLIVLLLIVLGKILIEVVNSHKSKLVLDPLTGLPNRLHLENEFERLHQQNVEMCLIVLDIDHFKSFNDNFGHSGGDVVLTETVKTIESELRETDVIVRWGGEEFVMLLPSCPKHTGLKLAEGIRNSIEKKVIALSNQHVQVTASIGVSYSKNPSSLSIMFEDADRCLYKAKNTGRNKVLASD